ncbi:unnamed protein product [Citrullus colocynthis]|uniref:Uncharacterized protein n=1 Tax=Citrullus colocynthis TaxID=252529 RepID=A0ABP0YA29_9ROSI
MGFESRLNARLIWLHFLLSNQIKTTSLFPRNIEDLLRFSIDSHAQLFQTRKVLNLEKKKHFYSGRGLLKASYSVLLYRTFRLEKSSTTHVLSTSRFCPQTRKDSRPAILPGNLLV